MNTPFRLSVLSVLTSISLLAQAPQKFSYQTVIRNSGGQLLANQQVGIKISVLQGSENGIVVFAERHTPATNANGLASLQIGTGTVLNGSFSNINWSQGSYFITSETDPNGGTNYTIVSTQQLLSVPYALYAETSGNSIPGPQGPAGPQGPQGPQGNPATDDQQLSVSATGDTLFLQGGGFIIIPGISSSNQLGGQNNILEHSCGTDNIHNPAVTYGSMTDQDGNTYRTTVIGNQVWMAENLKVSHYRNGDAIPNITNGIEWIQLESGAWCYYNNQIVNECPNGKLYNWYSVTDPRNLCPVGWHAPSMEEIITLANSLGGIAIAGEKLKSTCCLSLSTNETGFSGIPGGFRQFNMGSFIDMGGGVWWTIDEDAIEIEFSRFYDLGPSLFLSTTGSLQKKSGLYVRCLRD